MSELSISNLSWKRSRRITRLQAFLFWYICVSTFFFNFILYFRVAASRFRLALLLFFHSFLNHSVLKLCFPSFVALTSCVFTLVYLCWFIPFFLQYSCVCMVGTDRVLYCISFVLCFFSPLLLFTNVILNILHQNS